MGLMTKDDEFGIVAESYERGFSQGYEKGKEETIARAKKWLLAQCDNLDYIELDGGLYGPRFVDDFVKHLLK